MAKVKFDRDEIEVAGYYHGMLNLGIWNEKELMECIRVMSDKPWRRLTGIFNGMVASVSESDEMYDGMIDEINDWITRMRKGEKYSVQTWLGAKQGKTSREVFPNIGGKKK